ncbi:PilZ domain-containing protein [Sphingomonas lutea]|uniref:PilZ domain-containing protein n=1 Tax=Sphingomonas lutea TaxID=1045317 RepID=A0A7G9SIU3_9SPHN|nr:PilZ domain-containing protein [Sphingomonas lutea]QNN67768.1 PilZ domain-containing protein [Sphingomonas lutea]
MASVSPSETAYEDRRAFPRVSVALPAFLQANGGRHSVQLLDLSAGGAKLACAAPIPVGTGVILDCGTLALAAEVRWDGPGILGVAFDRPMDAREVAAMARRSTALEARMNAAR